MEPIIAIATPIGKSAIGIIRISFGNLKNFIIKNFFKKIFNKKLKHKYVNYVFLYNFKKEILDKGIAIYFRKPNSYTGENLLEFHGHGNYLNLKIILKNFLNIFKKFNLRLAKPGEFTKRAFINKKLNLIDVEIILNIINFNNKISLKLINYNLKFNLKLRIKNLIKLINKTQIYLNSSIITFKIFFIKNLNNKLNYISKKLLLIINNFKFKKINNNINIILLGITNVGKSTIINKLIKENFSITSSVAGTTRDLIQKTITFNDNILNFFDTAGLNVTNNKIENLGINLTLNKIKYSSIIIYIFDISNIDNIFQKIENLFIKKKFFLKIFNKIDLKHQICFLEIFLKKNYNFINVSAKFNIGICYIFCELKRLIYILNKTNNFLNYKNIFIKSLNKSYKCILKSIFYEKILNLKILSKYLNLSKKYLSEIIYYKKNFNYNNLFNKFCLGK